MTTITTDTETPDHGSFPGSIRATEGVVLRRNYGTNRLELWIDGNHQVKFVNADDLTHDTVRSLLDHVKKYYLRAGERKVQDAIKRALGTIA